jgi:hypothetical protein
VLTEHIDRAPSLLIAYAREHGVDGLTPPAPQGSLRFSQRLSADHLVLELHEHEH